MNLHGFTSYSRPIVVNTEPILYLSSDGDMTNIHFAGSDYVKVDMTIDQVAKALAKGIRSINKEALNA